MNPTYFIQVDLTQLNSSVAITGISATQTSLIATVMIAGPPGRDGTAGTNGLPGTPGTNGTDGVGVPVGGTANQVLAKIDGTNYNTQWVTPNGAAVWGAITGTLSAQTDLNTALGLKAPLASPTFTGTPTMPTGTIAVTQTAGNNTTALSTTAFVQAATVAERSASRTLTNARITPRTGTVASSATPTINTDNVDYFSITALAVNITSMTTNLSGTPTEGQLLWVAITGTATRTIAWGASFEDGASTLPTTTSGTTRLDVTFVWNATTSKWRCMASSVATAGGSGDVVGPSSATDNAIARFDSTTGKLIQNSGVTVGDNNDVNINYTAGVSGSPLIVTYDSAAASDPAVIIKNNTNYANGGILLKLLAFNASDTGNVFRVENAGSGKNISSANGTTETFSVARNGDVVTSTKVTVADDAYNATTWDGNLSVPTKNAVRDKIESMSAGSGIVRSINAITVAATAGASAGTDYVYYWTGSTTYLQTMPTAVSNTNRYTFINSGTVAQTVTGTSGQTFNGNASIVISPNSAREFISNNANWLVL